MNILRLKMYHSRNLEECNTV